MTVAISVELKKVHELKTWREPFQATWDGLKHCEVRVNDRGYCVGDYLRLREWDPTGMGWYTHRVVLQAVTHIVWGGRWGLPADVVVMSVQEISREEPA